MSHLKIISLFLRYAGNRYPLMRDYMPEERTPQLHSRESLMIRITGRSIEQYCPCFILAGINAEDRRGAPTGSAKIKADSHIACRSHAAPMPCHGKCESDTAALCKSNGKETF